MFVLPLLLHLYDPTEGRNHTSPYAAQLSISRLTKITKVLFFMYHC